MIITLILNVIIIIFNTIFGWLPVVSELPEIVGYDIDAGLQQAVGYINSLTTAFWYIAVIIQGLIALLAYYIIKMTLRFFLGNRV